MRIFVIAFVSWGFIQATAHAANPAHVAAFQKLSPHVQKIREAVASKKEKGPDAALIELGHEGMKLVGEAAVGLHEHLGALAKGYLGVRARSWEAVAEDPRPDELALMLISMRAEVIGGKLDRAQAVIDALGANVYLSSAWLLSAHAVALGAGQGRLPYGDFRTIGTQREKSEALFRRFFATPDQTLAAFAVPPALAPSADVEKFLKGILGTVAGTRSAFENYRRSYPQKDQEAVLNQLASELVDKPGAADCLNVARGMSDFDGAVCQPAVFEKAIDEYVAFFKQVGSGETQVLPTIEEFLLSLVSEKEGNPVEEADLVALAAELRAHVAKSTFHDRIKERWPAVEESVFGDPKKLKGLLGKGLALHRFLRDAIAKAGLASPLGFDGDYFENGEAAKQLKERFVKERLKDHPVLERVRVTTACRPYLDDKIQGTAVNTLVAASIPPRAEDSALGFRRLIFAHEVMLGDLKSIQATSASERMVSGLGAHYALRLLVPNLAQLRLLLGKAVPDSIEGLAGVKEKDMPGPLALVKTHYRFPDFGTVLAETDRAFQSMVRQAWETQTEKAAPDDKTAAAWFIKKYRAELDQGAKDLRELMAAKEKVKTEAAHFANPAISEILRIPVEFTGEHDQRFAAQLNHSLIHTFLPSLIQDYILRKFPDAKRDRAVYARHYQDLKSSFTIDQFMEQLDWYWGMDLVRQAREDAPPTFADVRAGKKRVDELPPRPLRRPDFIGVEEMKLLWAYPEFAGRLLHHTLEAYQRKLDYLEYAEKHAYYRFPMLRWEENWKTYDDSRYELVLGAFLAHGQRQIEDIWGRREASGLLNYVAPNLPLLDQLLRAHPDQKRAVCDIQRVRGLWEKGTDIAMTSTAVVASTISLVPPLAPVGLAVDGVLLVAEGVRAYHRYQEFASAESLLIAGSAQAETAAVEDGGYLLRDLENRYGDSLMRVALQAAAMTPGVAVNLPLVARLPSTISQAARSGWTGLRAAHAEWRMAIAAERAAAKAALTTGAEGKSLWWAAQSGRLSNALSLAKATRDHLMFPFVHLGLAEKWAQRTLFQRLYPHLAWRRVHRLAWNTGGFLKDVVLHLPFSLTGYGWGRGLLARGVGVWGLYELTLWGVHSVSNVREAATVLVLERIQQDPANYGDLIEAMHQGEISHAELLTIVQLDDALAGKYRTALHDWAEAYRAAETRDGRAEAVKNLETLEQTLRTELGRAEGEKDPQKARTWRRVLRDSKRLRLELSSTP